jgi:hypothetical protein
MKTKFPKKTLIHTALLLLSQYSLQAQNSPPLLFEGTKIKLEIQTEGSAITHFSLKKNPVNPFTWTVDKSQMPKPNQDGPVFRGHFLSMGRWGAASEAEQKAGIPHNGEVNTLTWKVTAPVHEENLNLVAESECLEVKDQMKVSRKITVPKTGTSFLMSETVENLAFTDRIYNFTQHPTIGEPFLDPSTLIDCNASLGFDQRTDFHTLEKSAFTFPEGHLTDGYADLRTVNEDRGYVTTHIFPDTCQIGWVTATSPSHKLLLGYIFRTKEYPWLNLWHWKKDRKPHAHGLEFGTTGLGQPYKLLVDNCVTFFGRKSYDWIETGERVTKKYICFLIELPDHFEGVGSLQYKAGKVIVAERRKEKPRTIEFHAAEGL